MAFVALFHLDLGQFKNTRVLANYSLINNIPSNVRTTLEEPELSYMYAILLDTQWRATKIKK